MFKVKTQQIGAHFRQLEDVRSHGSLTGESMGKTRAAFMFLERGRLTNPDDVERFNADRPNITYVVKSYDTPIAWVANGVWYRVEQRFSVTTSKHQAECPATGTPAERVNGQ